MLPCWSCRGARTPVAGTSGSISAWQQPHAARVSCAIRTARCSGRRGLHLDSEQGCKRFLAPLGAGRPSRSRVQPAQALFRGLGDKIKGDPGKRVAKMYQPQVDEINSLEPQMQKLSDEELRAKTKELKSRVQNGERLDSLLPEAFAVAREASSRVLGLRPFDVQLVGGIVLHQGRLAEMRTGEGKTLVAVLPAYLNALAGKGVQIVTVNDYLARRDSEWVGQVHRFLGLEVGLIQADLDPRDRHRAYRADVTYVTNSELGFDYLRDNLALSKEGIVLRDFNFAIIDEVDSVLIDEARTPLIISGSAEAPSTKYHKAAKLASALERGEDEGPGVHYKVDEKQKSILLTEEGYEAAEDVLGVTDLYEPKEQWASYLINALKAKELHFKDVNYIVRKGEVIIVDEFTGRTMPGRRWSDGLHQAIEAKEGADIQNESVTLASISYQSLFRSFPKLAGMTGTAATESEEFSRIYELEVTQVPTNKPVNRSDSSDVVFRNTEGKWGAVTKEIKRMNQQGRPVLVGTTSVEQSEDLAERLGEEGLRYQLLNAKPENVERESEIVAQSGRRGMVTIATNMAGRGTDIILGGNPEYMARLYLRSLLMPEVVNQTAASEDKAKGKAAAPKTWAVSPDLFPCQLSPDTLSQAKEAVGAAREAWGRRALEELEAEERLSVACEKAPTQDAVTKQLRQAFKAMEREFKAVTDDEKREVVDLGGLHVIGTERHEARRVDNQLRGRSGRQGDPGSTRFFLSLDDNMFRIFGGDRIRGMMSMFQIEDVPIESRMLTNALDEAQRKVESYFFDMRRNLFDFDQVLNTQRNKVYATRRQALLAEDLSETIVEFAEKTADDILEANVDAKLSPEQWPLDKLCERMAIFCHLVKDLTPEMLRDECGDDYEEMRYYLRERIVDAYKRKKAEADAVEAGMMQQAQQFFLLSQTDNLWQEHLQAMKFLQTAIGLRGYAQRDPLTEYKLEGYTLFLDMMARIRRNVIYNVFIFDAPKVKANTDARDSMLQRQARENGAQPPRSEGQPQPEPAGSAVKI